MLAYLVAVAIVIGIYALLTISLDLQYGFTGLVNFGQVAFYALGAYASALTALATHSVALGFVAAIVVAAIAALPIGALALRLREDYLAIVTLGFSEVVRLVLLNEEKLTGGGLGLTGIPRPFANLGPGAAEIAYLALVVACNIVVVLIVRRVTRSPFGRLIRAIRDNEVTVASLGKSPPAAKVKTLVLGAAIAGLAGALYAHYITFVTPDQYLPVVTFYVWMASILGGVSTLRGAIAGAAVLVLILEGTRFVRDFFPSILAVQMASVRLALVGLALVLFVLYRPQGVFGRALPR
ncbi:MAG TPA: branched-chain amino acid ABC transporter permease [Casimicrobiaceae bacterium]|nr:branched-chain amino acid ABC transporter permease [Casimicrobiaceae bacterium]